MQNESELRMHENTKHHLEEQIRQHKEAATKSREYYKTCQEKCKTSWSEIVRLTNKSHRTAVEREELESLQHCFTLTISADYQQSKLIPSWGKTEQPGSTYYLQKVSHDVFGIVDHRQDKSTIYLFVRESGRNILIILSLYWWPYEVCTRSAFCHDRECIQSSWCLCHKRAQITLHSFSNNNHCEGRERADLARNTGKEIFWS